MTPIKDWKGNEIKAGMVIYFVQKHPLQFGRFGMALPWKGFVWTESFEDYEKRRNEIVWELGKPHTVSEIDGKLFITEYFKDDPDIEQITSPLYIPFGALSNIAIKGISDQKPEL